MKISHAKLTSFNKTYTTPRCSICGYIHSTNTCPNCGSKAKILSVKKFPG